MAQYLQLCPLKLLQIAVSSAVYVYSVMSDICDPMDCSPAGSSVHGIIQERILEWIVMPFSIFLTQELNLVLLHCRQILYHLSYRDVCIKIYKQTHTA